MKQYKNIWLMGALVCGLGLGVTACSDDDDDKNNDETVSTLTIDSDLKTHGVEVDMQSAVVEVAVKSDGLWTASLPANVDWVQILDWKVKYEGNATLTLVIDENLSKADRTTTLKLGNSDGEYQSVTVRQNYNYKGQAPSNGSGQAFANKGLGTGIDYDYAMNVKLKTNTSEDFQPTKVHLLNNIFNITRIEALQASGKLQKSAYVEAPIELADLTAALIDSSVVQSKSVDMSLDLSVSFGVIEFSAHAKYNSRKEESRAHVDYTITREAPMYNVYMSPAELAAYAAANRSIDQAEEDQYYKEIDELIATYKKRNEKRRIKNLNEDGLTAAQQEEIDNMYDRIPVTYDHAGIFSTNFKNRYNQLYSAITRRAINHKATDTATADQVLNSLDNEYGPFFIVGGDFGGSLTMHCEVDTMYLNGQAKFEGSLEGGMGGLFNVEGAFTYTEEGYNLLRNSNTRIKIFGGNANDTADAMLEVILGGNATDLPKWQSMLKGWLSSMYSDSGDPSDTHAAEADVSKASPISFTITPIWTLFAEADIQEYVQNYFMKKYESRGIYSYFGIMNGTKKANADETLNADSDFWKVDATK